MHGARAAPCKLPGEDFFSPAPVGIMDAAVGAAQGQCCGERRGTLPRCSHRSSPSLSWPISSDRQTQFLSPKQSPCPAKHTKRIHYPMGDRKEGRGGLLAHNAHKWRAGPPLLCLGRKGRDPRRSPVNGSIVSEPSVALGVPGPQSTPPPALAARLGQQSQPVPLGGESHGCPAFLGSERPTGHHRGCRKGGSGQGVLEGLSFGV